MSILYDESQQAIASESRRILEARTNLETQLPLLESEGEYASDFWNIAKEQGWTALAVPEPYGGLDLGLVELGLIALQAGRSLSGAPFLTSNFGVQRALLDLGNDRLKEMWLPRLASGDTVGAVAFTEGQDALGVGISLAGDRLTGDKHGVIGGLYADIAVVLANSHAGPALVAAPLEGVKRTPLPTFDNSRCAADIHFADTPAEIIVSGPAAIDAALHILALQSVVTAHEQTGGAEILMEVARDYAVTRKAFGQPIGGFQSVKHRIAELYAGVELARAASLHAASREGKSDVVAAAAAARLSATEAYDTAARDCIQIHGGIGVTWEAGLHLHMRRARSLAIEQGNGPSLKIGLTAWLPIN